MRERGFFTEPLHELYHLDATIFRAARIIVDTSLHMGEMTFDEAVTFMSDKAALPEPARRRGRPLLLVAHAGLVLPDRLPRDPAIRALLRGARLRRRARPTSRSILREFHDELACAGSCPSASPSGR